MIRVLFVCHGNICRSPMAEFVMKDLVKKAHLEDEFEIASAATSTEEIWGGRGNPVYPPARAKLKEHGIDPGGKRARRTTREDYKYYDYLIGMDYANVYNMKAVTRTAKYRCFWITVAEPDRKWRTLGIRTILMRPGMMCCRDALRCLGNCGKSCEQLQAMEADANMLIKPLSRRE